MYLFQLQNLETPVWISLHIGDFAFELITGVEWTNQNTRKVTTGVLKEIMREITFSLLSLYWSLSRLIMEQSLVTRGNRMHTNNHECFVLTLFFLLTGNSEHTVTNSAHFLSTFSIVSFDVESLFTNVPMTGRKNTWTVSTSRCTIQSLRKLRLCMEQREVLTVHALSVLSWLTPLYKLHCWNSRTTQAL